MNNATSNFKDLPIAARIQLVEDIWDSIAEETPDQLRLTTDERAELRTDRPAR